MLSAEAVSALLGLVPHPVEGGHFAETYRSDDLVSADALPRRYVGPRHLGTAIYYLITPDGFSAMHRLRSDEIFHFYVGDPVEMLQLLPDGTGRLIVLGHDLEAGMQPQALVPRTVWQGSRLVEGGAWALLGATVVPGFDYTDYEAGRRDDLVEAYPEFQELIVTLTR